MTLKGTLSRLIKKQADTAVVIPALNEAATIEKVITVARSTGRVGEVIVVDDGSIDETVSIAAAAGSKVICSSHLGKGASMADGLAAARLPFVVFLDGDLVNLKEGTIDLLVRPLEKKQADLVKGSFFRSQGRVTELVAKPLLRLFFPELRDINQPLSGQMAIRRELGRQLKLENDYGVEAAMLIDLFMLGHKVIEVDLGGIEHRHHDLHDLSGMAFQVAQTILQRAELFKRIDGESLRVMSSLSREMEAAVESFSRLGISDRTVLLNLECVIPDQFTTAVARRFGFENAAETLLEHDKIDPTEKITAISRLMAGIPQDEMAQLAKSLPLGRGAVQTVIDLRRLGFKVGIITDEFLLPAEIARRRVFADFAVGNMLEYVGGQCTGNVRFAEAYRHPEGCRIHSICKSNILWHLKDRAIQPEHVVAVGRTLSDVCLLTGAGLGIAFTSADKSCREAAKMVLPTSDLSHVAQYMASLS